MDSNTQPAPTPMWMVVLGWIITALPGLGLCMSGVVKLIGFKPPEGSPNIGWSESAMLGLGIVELGCALLYLFPPTAVLGAILVTGYLGGAVATHERIGDMFSPPILAGVLVWLGLLLRDARVRAILPWRGDPSVPATGGFLAGFGKFVLILVVIVGVIAGLIEAQPTEYHLTRSITIDAPPAQVFEHVNDFHKWNAWSPWAEKDPNAKITFGGEPSGPGAIYTWSESEKLGEGRMTLQESKPTELVKIKLDFIKPNAATCETDFRFRPEGDKIVVTWSLSGKNEDFISKAVWLFVIDRMVGADFEKGLQNMKTVVEAKKK